MIAAIITGFVHLCLYLAMSVGLGAWMWSDA